MNRNTRGRATMTAAATAAAAVGQHRRGHSTGSMTASKVRDDHLALFHEMQARERNNFLYPNTDDIEASLSTKFGGISGYRSPRHRGSSDLLGIEYDKNDYDWLLTPPGTPLFPSLDAPPNPEPTITAPRSKTARGPRTSPSPNRPSSPALSRRPSSPSRPVSRPATPPGRPSTPGRTSTPTRRTLTPSSSFTSNSSTKSGSSAGARTARSSSPSRKPRTIVHPAMPSCSAEPPPPNLRTSVPDRPTSNPRGSSVSPRVGASLKTSQISDPGDVGGRNRRAISPSFSRSYSSSASSSKGSVVSSQNSGVEVNRPTTTKTGGADGTGKRPISRPEETSPVKPLAKKSLRAPGVTSFSSRKPFESSTREFRRPSTSGFRPLMSNSHISTFYTRTSSLNRPSPPSITDSSINSSAASHHGSDHEEETSSRNMEVCSGKQKPLEDPKPVAEVEMHDADVGLCTYPEPASRADTEPAKMETEASEAENELGKTETDLHRAPDKATARSVESILDAVIDRVMLLAEESHRCTATTGATVSKQVVLAEPSRKDPVQAEDFSLSCSSMEVYQFDQELQTTDTMIVEPPPRDNPVSTSGVVPETKDAPYTRATIAAKPSRGKTPSFGFGAKQYLSGRKRESRESNSSLFSIQMCSSKGESFSSGRPNSIDTMSSMDTPRRYPEFGGDTSSTGRYKSEDDTKSEESCVDYYIVEPSKPMIEKRESKVQSISKHFDAEDGCVDYYIDDYSSQANAPKKNTSDLGFVETEKLAAVAEDIVLLKTVVTEPAADEEQQPAFVDDTRIEVCSMDDSSSESESQAEAQDDIDMVPCWKPEEREDMDCDEVAEAIQEPPESERCRESTECSQALSTVTSRGMPTYSTENIIFCSSIVHEIMCKAAALGIEKEDLKALATPTSTDDLVTFLGLPKGISSNAKAWNVPQQSSTTVRQTLAYMQNQKMMQNTTVAYMQQDTLGRVQEDVKEKEHHFAVKEVDPDIGKSEHQDTKRKPKSNKCRCTIL